MRWHGGCVLDVMSIFRFSVDYLDLASIFGLLAVATVFLWPFFARRKTILVFQSVGAGAFAMHFLLRGADTAAVASCIALAQVLATAFVRRKLHVFLIYVTSLLILVSATIATWHGVTSLLAIIGSLLATAARLQKSTVRMQSWFLVAGPVWVAHNLIVGSIFGLTVDALSMASTAVGLGRSILPKWMKVKMLHGKLCVCGWFASARKSIGRSTSCGPISVPG